MSVEDVSFKEQLRRFRETAQLVSYRGLILVGTFQADTAAMLVNAINPERIAVLLTDETRAITPRGQSNQKSSISFPDLVIERLTAGGIDPIKLRCQRENWLCPDGDHSTTLRVYEGLHTILQQWNDLKLSEIAVDLTGGKSTMTVGLAKAAHVLQLPTVYVNSDYTDGKPVPGTQRLDVPEDPYTVFGALKLEQAHDLANNHDYVSAYRLLQELVQHIDSLTEHQALLSQRREQFQILATLAEAYAAWDAFDLKRSLELFELLPTSLLKEVTLPISPSLAVSSKLWERRGILQDQYSSLQRLSAVSDNIQQTPYDTLRTDLPAVLALLGSLYTNALRREAQRRYDFAALLLYRCLELMSRRRLATHSRDAERSRMGLFAQYQTLQSIGDPLLARYHTGNSQDRYHISTIQDRANARNKSILAHGFRQISEDEYRLFRELTDDFLGQFLVVEGCNMSQAEWVNTFTFVALE